tara:strand:- start:2130 stop:3389 length:1260 start_codon:yes stop_codon:yes gene_type:complete
MNTENSRLKELFKFLDSRLIIDKSIDFVLIFIGLLAALSVENYLEKKKQEKEYISNLISLHSELETNLLLNEGNIEAKLIYFNIWEDVSEFVFNSDFKKYDGIMNIYDSEPLKYENKTYLSLNKSLFINRELLADIIHVYDLKSEVSSSLDELTIALEDFYETYFDLRFKTLYANSEDVINPYSDFNFNRNRFEKLFFLKVDPNLKNLEGTGNRILTSIQHELEKYNIDINESKGYSNYYWLANTSYELEKYDISLEYAKKGLEKIKQEKSIKEMENDEKSYYGRLHMQIVNNYWSLYRKDSLDFSTIDSLMSNSLVEWNDAGVYDFLCAINYMSYYYEKRDYESFKEQLKDYYISKYDKKYLVEWMSDWEEYIKKKEILDIIIKENPHEVGEEDFTITEDWVINKLLKPKTMKEFLEQ